MTGRKEARVNTGTSQQSSGASFAQDLRTWWQTKPHGFRKRVDIDAELQIASGSFGHWMAATAFPSPPLCQRLYSLTGLQCFSPDGRVAAQLEHEQKQVALGRLSHSAQLKRQKRRQYVYEAERQECLTDPDKAFTIRGDDWIVCLECGLMLKQIRDRGSATHLKEHRISISQYREGPDPDRPRYGNHRGLICNAFGAKRREAARAGSRLIPDRTRKYLRSPDKGRRMPPEWYRSHAEQGRRMAGTRDLGRDTEVLRLYIIESLPIGSPNPRERDTISRRVNLSQSRVHAILRRIFGVRVKKRILFSRGELVTDLWANGLRERFGLSKLELRKMLRLELGTVKWVQELGVIGKECALKLKTGEPIKDGEGLFLEILAGAEVTADEGADYLRAVVPDLAAKLDGASVAIGIARDPAGLKDVCGEAQKSDRRARIALAFVPSAVAWLPTLDGKIQSLPVNELVGDHFLPMELRTSPYLLRRAIERTALADTKASTIRRIIVNALYR